MSTELDIERLRATQLYRPGRAHPDPGFSTGLWAEPIDRLLAARYAFLGCRFADHGHLFRGMDTGLNAALAAGEFGHFAGRNEMCEVERAMGVYFVTHAVSDAVTVSALHAGGADRGIAVFRAALFNRALDAHRAAVLAVGDMGLVFRYPLLTRPLTLAAIDHLIVPTECGATLPAALRHKRIVIEAGERGDCEARIAQAFRQLGIEPAVPLPDSAYPR